MTLTGITETGGRVSFRVISWYQTLRVRSIGDTGSGGLFTVDGAPTTAVEATIRSAPFRRHTIEAVAGAPLGEGIRRGFSGWQDAPDAPRVRSWTTALEDQELVAVYGGQRELRFGFTLEGGRFGVPPGTLVTAPASPDLWFDEGT